MNVHYLLKEDIRRKVFLDFSIKDFFTIVIFSVLIFQFFESQKRRLAYVSISKLNNTSFTPYFLCFFLFSSFPIFNLKSILRFTLIYY